MHIPPKLTYFATAYNRNGTERRVTISLPYVSIIASEPHYTAPAPVPEPQRVAIERPPGWSEKLIRRSLGRDRKRTERMINRAGYAATLRRIDGGGV